MADRSEVRARILVGLMDRLPPTRVMSGKYDDHLKHRLDALEKIALDSESGGKAQTAKRGPGRPPKAAESDKSTDSPMD